MVYLFSIACYVVGVKSCKNHANTYRYGNYHLSVTDADAIDTIDSEPAVILYYIRTGSCSITNPSINFSLLPGATNPPTGTLSGSNDNINNFLVFGNFLIAGGAGTCEMSSPVIVHV